MPSQIESPGRRAAAYWFIDGLPEIAFGLAFLIFGLFGVWFVERGREYRQHWWIFAIGVAVELLPLVMFIMHRRILDALKARITYPRTGYVRPPADFPNSSDSLDKILTLGTAPRVDENISTFRSNTVFLFIFGFVVLQFVNTWWALPVVMCGLAVCMYFWNRNDVHPYSWRAVLPIAVAGFIAAPIDLEPSARWLLPLIIGGGWLFGMGAWTLFRYLRAHPKPVAGEEGLP